MMVLGDLLHRATVGAFHVVQTDESALRDRVVALIAQTPSAAIRIIRGAKSTNESSFFDESAAALQFPYYFGENWDAFNDVFGEFTAMPAKAYLFVVSSAELLLRDAPADALRILLEIISDIQAGYAKNDFPLHVVFQCATAEANALLSERLSKANATFDRIDVG